MEKQGNQKKSNTVTLLREKMRKLVSISKGKLDALRIQKIHDDLKNIDDK